MAEYKSKTFRYYGNDYVVTYFSKDDVDIDSDNVTVTLNGDDAYYFIKNVSHYIRQYGEQAHDTARFVRDVFNRNSPKFTQDDSDLLDALNV